MTQDTFSIYQIPGCEKNASLLFVSYDWLTKKGLHVDRANYKLIYTAPLEAGVTLEDLFARFNISHPCDYCGRSLSVSDVVVLCQDGRKTAYYVDITTEYVEVPEFCSTGEYDALLALAKSKIQDWRKTDEQRPLAILVGSLCVAIEDLSATLEAANKSDESADKLASTVNEMIFEGQKLLDRNKYLLDSAEKWKHLYNDLLNQLGPHLP